MDMVIGTCSLCGGAVVQPIDAPGTAVPTPSCSQCGAIRVGHGPMIPMMQPLRLVPRPYYEPIEPYIPYMPFDTTPIKPYDPNDWIPRWVPVSTPWPLGGGRFQ